MSERLLASLSAARDAAAQQVPLCEVRCIPSRAKLCCVPLELRCSVVEGLDVSRINALRFSASEREVSAAKPWQCVTCSWYNSPATKRLCEMCQAEKPSPGFVRLGAPQKEPGGFWPVDLEEEQQRTELCRAVGEERVLATFDFDDLETFRQQKRILTTCVETCVTQACRMNAIAVYWSLGSEAGAVSTAPAISGLPETGAWRGKRQAVYYLGYDIGLAAGEKLKILANFKDEFSKIKFDVVEPRLVDRLGLIKTEVSLTNLALCRQVADALDLRTNRLSAPIPFAGLSQNDKMISFGPFDLAPGQFQAHHWERLEERLRLHAERPRPGDQPITATFVCGAFEGTVRWPVPCLDDSSLAPRLPRYFEAMRQPRYEPYLLAVKAAFKRLNVPDPRLLEIGCGPVPLLSMCCTHAGVRAWAVEMDPQLRDLAAETVRENGLEMVSQHGFSNYSFFGTPKKPEDPSVRVMRASPSTSLARGIPKLLDGAGAHVAVCIPDDGLLGEDFLVTMRRATELLEPGGVLVPSAMLLKVMPVEWLGHGADVKAELFGKHVLEAPSSDLRALCSTSVTALRIDLSELLEPASGFLVTTCYTGTLSAIAFWHEPCFEDGGAVAEGVPENAMMYVLPSPRKVEVGSLVRLTARVVEHELRLTEADDDV